MLMQCFIDVKVNFEKKNVSSHWEFSVSCTSQEYDNVTTPYYPIFTLFLSSGCLREVKNKGNFQTFSSKSCHYSLRGGHLQEAPNIMICLGNFWYFGKLIAEER